MIPLADVMRLSLTAAERERLRRRMGMLQAPLHQRLNAAFLLALAEGEAATEARTLINHSLSVGDSSEHDLALARFYQLGLEQIPDELQAAERSSTAPVALPATDSASDENSPASRMVRAERLYALLFPEGRGLLQTTKRPQQIEQLRRRRQITITQLNSRPLQNPAAELLFSSNVLVTLPLERNPAVLDDSVLSWEQIEPFFDQQQRYWYDHPIPIGTPSKQNEVIHGLQGLNSMMQFEKERGAVPASARVSCVLSLSSTHESLAPLARLWLKDQLQRHAVLPHLRVWLFTEEECQRLVDEVLLPVVDTYLEGYLDAPRRAELRWVFGIEGQYGRHYSFLKAIAALWQVLIDPAIRGTFKIDLDQVFPQSELMQENGHSALDAFRSPLWGALGRDYWGKSVELGMIAGALVNQNDISHGLYTPDVRFPTEMPQGDQLLFYSRLTQALSTEGEMMTRYDAPAAHSTAAQRVHVTGGTNGILIEHLRRHRPFTPSFIGRAEDQAYLLSVLFEREPVLRYLHQPYLIMRHDKQGFAAKAIAAAAAGKQVGDWERVLLFSFYARALPWSVEQTKQQIDPFTGCFVSQVPVVISWLRCAFTLEHLWQSEEPQSDTLADEIQRGAARRLYATWQQVAHGSLKERYQRERRAWHDYYDILQQIERGVASNEAAVQQAQRAAHGIVRDCLIVD